MKKQLKYIVTVGMLLSLSVGVTACKSEGGEQSSAESSSVSIESSVPDSSIEPVKDAEVLALENEIASLPDVENVKIADMGAVKQAETAFLNLSETQKAMVGNYDKLFSLLQKIVFLNNTQSADMAIASLADADEIMLEDEKVFQQVYDLVQSLTEEERTALAGYEKLLAVHVRITSLKKIAQVTDLISALPSYDVIDETHLSALEEAETAFSELTEAEQEEVVNATHLIQSRVAITASYWKDAKMRKHYVVGRNLTFQINLKQNTVSSLTVDGAELPSDAYTYADGILTIREELLKQLSTGMHAFALTDSRNARFPFTVGVGYDEKTTVYFDFDVTGYKAPAQYGVPCEVVEDGIDGKSGHFIKSTSLANVFAFFKGGEFGFVDYTFKTGKVYLLEFDVKILDGTGNAWWMPIYFGGKGDVAYLYKDYALVFPQVNTLYSQGGIEMRDGYAHVKAIFLATQETTNLEFANWGAGVDILLDNILLTTLPEDAVLEVESQIRSLADQITPDDKSAVEEVKRAYDALSLAEKQIVSNVEKLNDLFVQLDSIQYAETVTVLISALPEPDMLTVEAYDALYYAKSAYDSLTKQAQTYVTNYEKLATLLQLIGASYWNEAGVEFYVEQGETFSVRVELLENGVKAVTLNGKAMDAEAYTYANGVLDFGDYFVGKPRDVYTLSLTDGKDKTFTFFLYWGIKKGSAIYFDFEHYTYTNTNGAAVASSQYADGIQGTSQRFQKSSAAGTVFGFFKDGNFGFVPYNFKEGTTYTLSFDIKIMEGTAAHWWMPLFFSEGKGDLVYVRQTNGEVYLQTYSVDSLNAKNRQSIVDNGDGSYRVTVTFTLQTGVTYNNIEFSNFDGAIDILLDNVLLIQEA